MPLFETLSLALLVALGWLWFDSAKARDIAVAAARRACAAESVQLLDDTVAVVGLKLSRDEAGRLLLHRTYAFEYSVTGDDRRPGRIVMLGAEVLSVRVGPNPVES